MPHRFLLLAVVACLALAGCARPSQDTQTTPASGPPEVPGRPGDPAERAPAIFIPARALNVDLTVEDRWVRPGDPIVAQASVDSPGALFEWFFASRNPPVPGTPPSTTFGAKAEPQKLASEESSAPLALSRPLRHVFSLDGGPALVNVTVSSSRGSPQSWLVRITEAEGGGLRFIPDDVFAYAGDSLVFRNDGASLVTIVQADVMAPVAPAAPRAVFNATNELGDYDLVVVVRDGQGGRGEALARVIVDIRKPEANQTLGPWTGTLQRPALGLPGDAPNVHEFTIDHAARAATLVFNATSSAPPDPAVRVRVVDANDSEVALGEGASGALDLGGLARGTYRVVVESTAGLSVSYAAEARVELILVPPASFFNT